MAHSASRAGRGKIKRPEGDQADLPFDKLWQQSGMAGKQHLARGKKHLQDAHVNNAEFWECLLPQLLDGSDSWGADFEDHMLAKQLFLLPGEEDEFDVVDKVFDRHKGANCIVYALSVAMGQYMPLYNQGKVSKWLEGYEMVDVGILNQMFGAWETKRDVLVDAFMTLCPDKALAKAKGAKLDPKDFKLVQTEDPAQQLIALWVWWSPKGTINDIHATVKLGNGTWWSRFGWHKRWTWQISMEECLARKGWGECRSGKGMLGKYDLIGFFDINPTLRMEKIARIGHESGGRFLWTRKSYDSTHRMRGVVTEEELSRASGDEEGDRARLRQLRDERRGLLAERQHLRGQLARLQEAVEDAWAVCAGV